MWLLWEPTFRRNLAPLRSVPRLLVPSSPTLVTLMKEALGSSETSVLTRATRRNNPEDTILHSYLSENLISYMKKNCWGNYGLCEVLIRIWVYDVWKPGKIFEVFIHGCEDLKYHLHSIIVTLCVCLTTILTTYSPLNISSTQLGAMCVYGCCCF
jgi:hypothetical protein